MAYTTIDDPSAYFHTQLYNGNGSSQSITNDANAGDFKPDWLWTKSRNDAFDHITRDSSRGVSKRLITHSTAAEDSASGTTSFDTDGFTLDSTNTVNKSTDNYVAWQWKANGGTTASNSNGSITSTVQANTTAGFSIVTFTGTGNDGDSYGHGLSSAPELVIPKRRDGATNWQGYAFDGGNSQYWYLNLNNAFVSTSGNSAASSSSVITTDGSGDSNPSGGTVVSYCFHSVQGYSKIGRYTGNGNADGPFIYTGFKPAWILSKGVFTKDWVIVDNKRNNFNVVNKELFPNTNAAEATNNRLDFLSNGFKITSSGAQFNDSGSTYIYMAFAEHPFVSSEGVPVTAR
jgi:hypothetical protein